MADLHRVTLADKLLVPETRDVLSEFANWFHR